MPLNRPDSIAISVESLDALQRRSHQPRIADRRLEPRDPTAGDDEVAVAIHRLRPDCGGDEKAAEEEAAWRCVTEVWGHYARSTFIDSGPRPDHRDT